MCVQIPAADDMRFSVGEQEILKASFCEHALGEANIYNLLTLQLKEFTIEMKEVRDLRESYPSVRRPPVESQSFPD